MYCVAYLGPWRESTPVFGGTEDRHRSEPGTGGVIALLRQPHRVEGHAAYGTERTAAAIRIASS
jgi:hypothetical protein